MVALMLFFCLLLVPEWIFILFEVDGNESAYFISRRAAILFLGYAILSYLIRNAQHSDARQAVTLGICASMLSLALLGIFELFRGFAGIGIILAVLAEVFIAGSYFSIWFSHRQG